MPKLIIVRQSPTGEEILLNFDQIECARVVQAQGTTVEVKMTNGHVHHLRETLDELIHLSEKG